MLELIFELVFLSIGEMFISAYDMNGAEERRRRSGEPFGSSGARTS